MYYNFKNSEHALLMTWALPFAPKILLCDISIIIWQGEIMAVVDRSDFSLTCTPGIEMFDEFCLDSKPLYILWSFFLYPHHSWLDQGSKQIHRLTNNLWPGMSRWVEPIRMEHVKQEILKTLVKARRRVRWCSKAGPRWRTQSHVEEPNRVRGQPVKRKRSDNCRRKQRYREGLQEFCAFRDFQF